MKRERKGVRLLAVLMTAALLGGCSNAAAIEGDPGPAGIDGASAYEIAVANGFDGTEIEWLASLVGPGGTDGVDGFDGRDGFGVDGADGTDGRDGRPGSNGRDGRPGSSGPQGPVGASAYELAKSAGFGGSLEAWLESLRGADGAPGAPGTPGTPGADGSDGASAYDIAVANGFEGDEAEWLASLRGADGSVFITADNHNGEFASTGPILAAGESLAAVTVSVDSADGSVAALFGNTMLFPLAGDVTSDLGLPLMMGMGWLQKGSSCPVIVYDGGGRPTAPAGMVAGSEFALLAGASVPVLPGSVTAGVELAEGTNTFTLCVTVQPLFGGEQAGVTSSNLVAIQGEGAVD